MPTGPILVTGSTGQVGKAIVALLAQQLPGVPVHAPTRAELDLTSPASIRGCIRQTRPRSIVNPAAYTAVDKAESEPALAHLINAEAPAVLAECARELDATLIHFSTDYVFDGTSPHPYVESDPTNPLGVYGASKLLGEKAVLAASPRNFVFRTSWVYAPTGKNFLLTILRLARERALSGQPLNIVADQHGAPTGAGDLAALTLHTLGQATPAPGLYHATCSGSTTWHGFAMEIVRQARERNPSICFATPIPISTADFPTPARRPANSRLDCTRLATALAFVMPPWQQALSAVTAQM